MDISLIIPVMDRVSLISRTLDSVLNSDVFPSAIIVVDNGSTDGTLEICEKYEKEYPIVKLVRESKKGAAAARNRGLKECQTEWVYFFDSDDEFDRKFLPFWEETEKENYDIVIVNTMMIQNGKGYVRKTCKSMDPPVWILGSIFSTQSLVFRTSFLRRIGGWNDNCLIWDDWELGIRAIMNAPKILWKNRNVFHRVYVHPDSLTGDSFSSRYEALVKMLTEVLMEIDASESRFRKQKMKKALYFRTCILLGNIRHENNEYSNAAGQHIRSFLESGFKTVGKVDRFIGKALESYSSHGWRGAWRIARLFCQSFLDF